MFNIRLLDKYAIIISSLVIPSGIQLELMVSELYPRRTVFVCQSVVGNGIGVVRKGLFLLLRLQIDDIFCQSLRLLKVDHHEALP